MNFELVGDLFNNASPFYVYVGILWSIIGAIRLINMDMSQFTKHHPLYVKHTYRLQDNKAPIKEPLIVSMDMMTWLIHKMKQMEAPDDDNDDPSSRFLTAKQTIRGGEIWEIILCSHPLKNIVL